MQKDQLLLHLRAFLEHHIHRGQVGWPASGADGGAADADVGVDDGDVAGATAVSAWPTLGSVVTFRTSSR